MGRSIFGDAFRGHRVDSKILIAFLGLALAVFALLWLASEVLEEDTFAINRTILRGLRSDNRYGSSDRPGVARSFHDR